MAYSTLYQFVSVLLPLITIPYVSRVLGPGGIGINAVTNANMSYFMLLANLGIQIYGNREIAYVQQHPEEKSRLFFELTFLKFFAGSVSLLLYAIFVAVQPHWQLFYILQGINLLAVMCDFSWYFMGIEDFRVITWRNTFVKLLALVATFAFVRNSYDLWIYILILGLSTLLGNLSVLPFLRRDLQSVSWRQLSVSRHLKPALLLFLPQLVIQVYLSLNRTMLGQMDSVQSAGYFNQSDMLIRTAYVLVSSFSMAVLPRLSSLVASQKMEEVKSLTLRSFEIGNALSFLAIAGIIGISTGFAPFFFGQKFTIVGSLMMGEALVILFITWGSIFGVQFLLATKRMNAFALSAVVGLVVNVAVNFALIPVLGAMGAVIATVLTEMSVSFYQLWRLRDVFSLQEIFSGSWKYFLSGLLAAIVTYLLNHIMSAGLLSFVLQAVAATLLYLACLFILRAAAIDLVRPVLAQLLGRWRKGA